GRNDEALAALARARELAEGPGFSDVDRAAVLFRLGVCRYKLSSITTAVGLLTTALELAERSGLASDSLRADILGWRSRCYRRQRDWQAAREDVERARVLYEELADRANVGRMLNNLGVLNFLLGDTDHALVLLEDAYTVAGETGSQVDAG